MVGQKRTSLKQCTLRPRQRRYVLNDVVVVNGCKGRIRLASRDKLSGISVWGTKENGFVNFKIS